MHGAGTRHVDYSSCLFSSEPFVTESTPTIQEPRHWQSDGWAAHVIKNEDDDGWAVAMVRDGEAEPTLVGPWTMGRDKKNPKPLDGTAFRTLVKTATEYFRRSEQHLHATLHQSIDVAAGAGYITVSLDIEPDDDNPRARLSAKDVSGQTLAEQAVSPAYKLNRSSATAWVQSGFERPVTSP